MKLITTIAALSCCLALGVQATPTYFKVNGKDNTPCLIYGVDYSGVLAFKHLNGSSDSVTANFTRVDPASSYCANGSKTFLLTLTDASTQNKLTHTFVAPSSSNETYKLQSLVWLYSWVDSNSTNSTDSTPVSEAVQADSDAGWSIELHAANRSYLCNSQFNVTWSNKAASNNASFVWLSYSQLNVQVADIYNGNLSSNVTQCDADKVSSTSAATTSTAAPNTTTAAPTTTSAPITTPALPAHNGTYVLFDKNNKTCIVLDAGIGFRVPYTDAKSNKTMLSNLLSVPPADGQNVTVSGSCSNTSDVLVVNFFSGWSFTIAIKKNAVNYFAVDQVNLTYIPSSKYISGAVENATASVQNSNSSLGWFNTSVGNYYMCTNILSSDIGGSVTFETSFFRLQAFADFLNGTTTVGTANECVQDTPSTPAPATDNTVPIAVGAALAGLVLIVLIAYFIGRRRSRNGYQSM